MATKAAEKKAEGPMQIDISPPSFGTMVCKIQGISPYVSNRMSPDAVREMQLMQEAGEVEAKRMKAEKKLTGKDFIKLAEDSGHRVEGGDGFGIPCTAFRQAMIDACRLVRMKMTEAKMTIFVEPECYSEDGNPLVRIHGEYAPKISPAKNANGGTDLRARLHWKPDWTATLLLRWDNDQVKLKSAVNLLQRAGLQVGVGAGRPFSKMSAGCGWGMFKLVRADEPGGQSLEIADVLQNLETLKKPG